ncbi:MAG: 50S ribosomal protein L21e [Candidatus Aenigmatarchaeota archaeon]
MVKKSRGIRTKTREKLRQKAGYRPTITKFLQEFKEGQKVAIVQEPSSHSGMPHPRFKGRVGKVIGKRGKSYIVEITDGNKIKKIISKPEHLKAV